MLTVRWWTLRQISRDNNASGTGTGTGGTGAGGTGNTGTGTGAGAGDAGGTGSTSTGTGGTGAGDANRHFTQDELNSAVARERREQQARQQQLLQSLEKIKADGLTPDDRNALQQQIANLRQQTQTTEELAKQRLAQREQEWATERTRLESEVRTLSDQIDDMTVQSLFDTAMGIHAVKPGATAVVGGYLRSNLVKVPVLDAAGKQTGTEFKIDLTVPDPATKQPKQLRLSPVEAVAQLRQMEDFATLFAAGARSGTGSTGSGAGTGKVDIANMSQADYMRMRKENPAALGLTRS